MKERKILGSLAKFWRAVRERKLLIYRICGVIRTLVLAVSIWFILLAILLSLGKTVEDVHWISEKMFDGSGFLIISVIASAIGGYDLHDSMQWAQKKAQESDFDFDTRAFALGMTILSVMFLIIFIAGVYQLYSLIISL